MKNRTMLFDYIKQLYKRHQLDILTKGLIMQCRMCPAKEFCNSINKSEVNLCSNIIKLWLNSKDNLKILLDSLNRLNNMELAQTLNYSCAYCLLMDHGCFSTFDKYNECYLKLYYWLEEDNQ